MQKLPDYPTQRAVATPAALNPSTTMHDHAEAGQGMAEGQAWPLMALWPAVHRHQVGRRLTHHGASASPAQS